MRTEISKLHQRLGTTFIYVTHDQTEAMTMGTRIVVMNSGLIQQVDTPQNLYLYPCNLFVAGFIGSPQMNFIEAKLLKEGSDFFVEFGSEDTKTRAGIKFKIKLPAEKNKDNCLEEYIGKEVIMGIRPEDVHNEEDLLAAFPDGVVEANVEVTELMGAETYLYMNCEGHSINARVAPTNTARPGDTIKIAIEPQKIHLFNKDTEMTIVN
jgi:multiple sugar transport system ATP-binding protein